MVIIGEKPWVKYVPQTAAHGRFVVEPLERGYGETLGNSLRRVLLGSLSGAAVTSIRIDETTHEFSTIPGVLEDTLQIILNIKELVIKSYSDSAKIITLKAKGKRVVTAADIEHDAEIEIINPDHHIATLDGGKINMELVVEKGKGFVLAERNKKPGQTVGTIPIDALFSPIMKVNVSSEDIRVGQEIKYVRLILDVWTNGSIKPDEAMVESAKILSRHVDMFVNLGQKSEVLGIPVERKGAAGEDTGVAISLNIEDLELSARSLNCLKKAEVETVKDLIKLSEADLVKIKNFGAKSIKEIVAKLAEHNLALKGSEKEEK